MIYFIDIDKNKNKDSGDENTNKHFYTKDIIKDSNLDQEIKIENTILLKLKNEYYALAKQLEQSEKNYINSKNIFTKFNYNIKKNKCTKELKKINKLIKKSIISGSRYILSKSIKANDTLKTIIIKLLNELNCREQKILNDMELYIYGYIKEYIKRQNRKIQEVKLAIIYNGINTVDKKMYEKLVEKLKRVDIINMKGSSNRLQKFVDSINLEYGSSNIVTNKKNLREYDICINIDTDMAIITNQKFNKDAMIIDIYNQKMYINNIKIKDILNVFEYICCENNYLKDKELSQNAEILKILNNYEFTNNFNKTELYSVINENNISNIEIL